MAPVKVGIIGAGNISDQYLTHLALYPDVEVVALGDLAADRAIAKAEKYGLQIGGTPDVVLNHPDVQIVVNLTIPAVHAAVSKQIVAAGKHVWSEKPLATDREQARDLLDFAAAHDRRVGCAPDTVLGPGIQTVMRRISAGDIGRPATGLAIMQQPGPDNWHPDPEFLFQAGGGPVLDMGPYYLTALVLGLGAVTKVSASGGRAQERRTIRTGDRAGTEFDVTVPTTANAVLDHVGGASSVIILSFDSPRLRMGVLEFGGTDATIAAPDPNMFGGEISFFAPMAEAEVSTADDTEMGRGLGVVDMARSIAAGTMHRANGELAYHVLDVMLAIEEAVTSGNPVTVSSAPPVVDPIPDDWDPRVESA